MAKRNSKQNKPKRKKQNRTRPTPRRKRRPVGKIVAYSVAGVLVCLVAMPYVFFRPPEPPPGFHVQTALLPVPTNSLQLLVDDTAWDTNRGERVFHQEVFDAVLGLVRDADTFVYTDFFLWNGWQGAGIEQHRLLSSELAQALIERKAQKPELQVLCLTDPVNRAYGTREETFYSKLAQGGIPVVFTDLDRLPDSNPVYAYPVRFYGGLLRKLGLGQAWADRPRHRHPFQSGGDPVSTRQAVRLLRFKANHRKVVIADRAGGEPRMIVTSFNPADSSSAHANIGLLVSGEVARQALTNELACVTWSAEREANVLADRPDRCAEVVQRIAGSTATPLPVPESGPRVAWLTEGAIRARLISMLDDAGPGDRVRIAMFYLSDRVLVRSIKDAAFAGARVRVILDFNRDAFGRKKNGIPNRPVAAELAKFARDENLRMEVRWADTHGEQFHTKALSISNDEMGKHLFLCGSANWTRRNLSDLNMEANLYCERAPGVVKAFSEYFDRAWSNSDGLSHTLAFGSLAETRWPTIWKTALYVVQEVTGLCSF